MGTELQISAKRHALVALTGTQGGPIDARDLSVVYGRHTSLATTTDFVVTGLKRVLFGMASYDSPPISTAEKVLAVVGDQATIPPLGSLWLLQTDSANAPAPVAGRIINWMAVGYADHV